MTMPPEPIRPLIIPETFDGTSADSQWEQLIYHFSSVAEVNDWDTANKLKWLKVWLNGRAQLTLRKFLRDTQADYDLAVKALEKHFVPTTHASITLNGRVPDKEEQRMGRVHREHKDACG